MSLGAYKNTPQSLEILYQIANSLNVSSDYLVVLGNLNR